jgi:hypothetical protein
MSKGKPLREVLGVMSAKFNARLGDILAAIAIVALILMLPRLWL